ncbi:polysaccharide deacetylase family protein [Streptomyces candidus]|uniref:Peptidoglycan/xylan/chitin deacetylase (PgdA/CDA1 family) n=1 Tax=Streptomyces candidus TaxID=67283 RepID=A0A7X0LSG4_9ACTN|nr:polysaccharide deacetylase family protein [Streptomyces candidus]MBB6439230.1 peptidoglycan/xylan/chitin deacetylase (PgdA/CDA1 family) [Streptomyces candidus]
MNRTRLTRTTGLLLAAALLPVLTACSTLTGVISPAEARDDADGRAAGPVDCAEAKCVVLTFDGGPSAPTPKLLDVLKREKVPATFFLQGKGHTDTYPQTVTRMAKEGHEVANHTLTHKNLTELTPDEIRAEVEPVQKDIEAATGKVPNLLRPPGGATNDDVSDVLRELGLAQALWSVTAKDFQTTDSALIKQRVLDQTERDGIILLHERYAGTIPAVPGIISELRAKGYTFVTFSQLMSPAVPRPGEVYRP